MLSFMISPFGARNGGVFPGCFNGSFSTLFQSEAPSDKVHLLAHALKLVLSYRKS